MLGVRIIIGLLVSCAAALPPDEETSAGSGSCAASSMLQRGASVNSKRFTVQAEFDLKEDVVPFLGDHWFEFGKEDLCAQTFGWFHSPKTGIIERPLRVLLPNAPELPCVWPIPDYHAAISDFAFERLKGRLLGMFRDPAARAFSSYVYFSYQVFAENGGPVVPGCLSSTPFDPQAYKDQTRGLVTKQLTGQQHGGPCSACIHECDTQVPDVDKALERLDGFGFIGIAEHWELSMCLFHRTYHVPCASDWFENDHSTAYSNFTDMTLEDFQYADPFDEAVYGKARQIFWSRILLHNVTRESCQSTCAPAGMSLTFT